jgi:uncharacterized protein (DUF362 family)
MHQGHRYLNLNIALAAPLVWPHLSVLDGFDAMEGAGPAGGDCVPWRSAFAGVDALAVDIVVADLMGFPADEVGYLHYCARMGLGSSDLRAIELAGDVDLDSLRRPFRPHPTHLRQRDWHDPRLESLLRE